MALEVKGISYAIEDAPADVVRRNLRVIAEELHCTAVMLIGTDTESQIAAAQYALDAGLDVYVRPYFADRPRSAQLAHLAATASAAEDLRARHPGRVTLLVGSEFSLTSRGMIPGPRVFVRLQVLVRPRLRRLFDRRITRRLNALLADALTTARRAFHGPITYAAGGWEKVDWSGFDLIGVNLYRSGTDPAAYAERLRTLVREADKPVVIPEFGCGTHVGADRRGPGSFRIVQWFAETPRVKDGRVSRRAHRPVRRVRRPRLFRAHLRHAGLPPPPRPTPRPGHGRLRRGEGPRRRHLDVATQGGLPRSRPPIRSECVNDHPPGPASLLGLSRVHQRGVLVR